MQSLSDQEMVSLITLINKASNDQLRKAGEAIRAVSDLRSRQAIMSFSKGNKVKWNGKAGPAATGTVLEVKQKYVLVKEDGVFGKNWNIPAGMLTKIQ